MQTAATRADLWASHTLFNELHSQFQAWVAQQNALIRLGHPEGDAERTEHLKTIVDRIVSWRRILVEQGAPMLYADWHTDHPDVLAEAVDMLEALFKRLVDVGSAAREILRGTPALPGASDDVKFLISVLGWSAYAFQHAVHADVRFGEIFGDEAFADRMRQHLLRAMQEVETVNGFVGTYIAAGGLDAAQVELLRGQTADLPEPEGRIGAAAIRIGQRLKHLGHNPFAAARGE
jgi:hypothetical protein